MRIAILILVFFAFNADALVDSEDQEILVKSLTDTDCNNIAKTIYSSNEKLITKPHVSKQYFTESGVGNPAEILEPDGSFVQRKSYTLKGQACKITFLFKSYSPKNIVNESLRELGFNVGLSFDNADGCDGGMEGFASKDIICIIDHHIICQGDDCKTCETCEDDGPNMCHKTSYRYQLYCTKRPEVFNSPSVLN